MNILAPKIPLDMYVREIQATSALIYSGIRKLENPEGTLNTLEHLDQNLTKLIHWLSDKDGSSEISVRILDKICSQATNVSRQLIKSGVSTNLKAAAVRLLELSQILSHQRNAMALSNRVVYTDHETFENANDKKHSFSAMLDFQEGDELRVNKQLEESEARAYLLAQSIATLEVRTQDEIKKILTGYEKAAEEIEQKNNEINNILGQLSGRAIAGDYENSAASERRIANYLRMGSLFFMGVIACALIYTFIETTNTEFNWQKSIFRISLTFLLSVPAAYLARESAKHREQQYNHLQTSLDLKAIPPFLATLPEEDQNRFKLEIANRIFGAREAKVSVDSYPLNTQDIIMALIRKVEDFSPGQKSKSKQPEE